MKQMAERTLTDGNVMTSKKRKTTAKLTITMEPKEVTTATPRQAKRVRKVSPFSLMKLRSRENVTLKNDVRNKSKKTLVKKQREKKTLIKNNNTGEEVIEKKARDGKLAIAKEEMKTATKSKPKTKAPIVKKQKDEVKNGAVSGENPPRRTTRRRKR